MKVVAVIPVHLGSKRLPRKILLPIKDKPMLFSVVLAVAKAEKVDEIWVAASKSREDDELEELVKGKLYDIHFMRGEENDIPSRLVGIANYTHADYIINVDGEQPLTSPELIDKTVEILELGYPFAYIGGMPRGLTCYGFHAEYLKQKWAEYKGKELTEEWYKIFEQEDDASIDTKADYERIKARIENNE